VLILRTVGWLLSLVLSTIPCYWLAVHPRAEYWRTKAGSRFRLLGPLWIAMWIAAGSITAAWRHVLLYDRPVAWLPGAAFIGTGLYLYSRAHLSLDQLIGRPEVQGGAYEQRLIVTGIHARVRHPVYLGHLCELIGWSIGTGMAVIYCLTGFAIISGAIMIRAEERELVGRFGTAYEEYAQSVPLLIPSFTPTPEIRRHDM
jgi:protein-S-isoprenylcysteine O-methyltransferase Ste14